MMKKLMRFKKQGFHDFIGGILLIAICLYAIYCMTVMSVDTNKALDSQNHISSLLRSYLTKMETKGYLTDSDIHSLVEDLEAYGMTEINLFGNFSNGTTHAAVKRNYGPAAYGEDVILTITGTQIVKSMAENPEGFFGVSRGLRELQVNISQKGISVR